MILILIVLYTVLLLLLMADILARSGPLFPVNCSLPCHILSQLILSYPILSHTIHSGLYLSTYTFSTPPPQHQQEPVTAHPSLNRRTPPLVFTSSLLFWARTNHRIHRTQQRPYQVHLSKSPAPPAPAQLTAVSPPLLSRASQLSSQASFGKEILSLSNSNAFCPIPSYYRT